MLTEVATGPHADADRPSGGRSAENPVAASMSAAEEARRLRRDATAMVERLAVQARTAGLEHPVAAAVARGARMSRLCGVEEFARHCGLSSAEIEAAESGRVPFGELPRGYDPSAAAMGLDLLSLADLSRSWRPAPATQGVLF